MLFVCLRPFKSNGMKNSLIMGVMIESWSSTLPMETGVMTVSSIAAATMQHWRQQCARRLHCSDISPLIPNTRNLALALDPPRPAAQNALPPPTRGSMPGSDTKEPTRKANSHGKLEKLRAMRSRVSAPLFCKTAGALYLKLTEPLKLPKCLKPKANLGNHL